MKKFTVFTGIFISLASSLLLSPATVLAARTTGTNISTSPVATVLHVAPGQSTSTTLSIQNNASSAVGIQLQLETFKPYGLNGQAQVTQPQPHSAYVNWVHFSQSSLIASPGVWEHVQMTVSPPPTASLDYYYAVLVKPQALTTSTSPSAPTTYKGYNAILALLEVASPNARPKLQVTNFSATHGLYEYLPASFAVTTRNTGNVFLAPTGNIYISRNSNFKKIAYALPLNAAQGNVIPGSSRVFTTQWSDGFPRFVQKTVDGQPVTDKSGNPIERLTWDFTQANKFRFGRYYAKLVFVYNDGTRDIPTSAVVSFWVIPWKLGSLIILIIALLVYGLYVIGRKVGDRAFKLAKKGKRTDISGW